MEFTLMILASMLCGSLCLILRPVAENLGLIDIPDARKHHAAPTPVTGGMAMYCALVLCALVSLVAGDFDFSYLHVMLLCALPLVLTGVFDDRLQLTPNIRFIVQIGSALIAALAFDVRLDSLGTLLPFVGELHLGVFTLPVTVLGMVGLINAINMSDGVDGLAGSLVLVSLVGIAVFAVLNSNTLAFATSLVVIGAVVGYLFLNLQIGRQRAAVFMGDGGSLLLGFVLSWLLVCFSQKHHGMAFPPAAALWLVGLPLLDTVCIMLRRIRKGHSPFQPDREHLHHILLRAGLSTNQTVLVMAGIQALFVLIAIVMVNSALPEWAIVSVYCLVGLGFYFCMAYAWQVMKFIKSGFTSSQGVRAAALVDKTSRK